ncbi:MAG: hypothetical protein RR471_12380, partial [Bacteroides sp.]
GRDDGNKHRQPGQYLLYAYSHPKTTITRALIPFATGTTIKTKQQIHTIAIDTPLVNLVLLLLVAENDCSEFRISVSI